MQFSANKLQYIRNGARQDKGYCIVWRTNRKSHTRFRLEPKSSTLDDLQRPIRTRLQKRCVFWGPIQKFQWRQTHTISSKMGDEPEWSS